MKSTRIPLALALAVTTGMTAFAASTKFSDFTPVTSSATALPVDGIEEATPDYAVEPEVESAHAGRPANAEQSGDHRVRSRG